MEPCAICHSRALNGQKNVGARAKKSGCGYYQSPHKIDTVVKIEMHKSLKSLKSHKTGNEFIV